ncbi:unnamed protein product [Eruca vesicaria subsp. sativa]|uniref:Uncharacterized protein n=1 Tax=Eruca vesicaria subsp. sativa TaxID=29727 RepID=A0ABC8INP5_ERUVS|nr:unnamed protein product [Eruca vesicaria subsp. sativa]
MSHRRRRIYQRDTIMLLLPNSPEFALCFLAVAYLGAVSTTADPFYTKSSLKLFLIVVLAFVDCSHDDVLDRGKEILGTFSPQLEPYNHVMPEETTPSGMFARGSYSARTKFLDDDNKCYNRTVFEETRNETMAQELGNGHTMVQEAFIGVTEASWTITKAYQNYKFQQPYQQALSYCSVVLQDNTWPWTEELDALSHLELEDLVNFVPLLLSRTFLECYIAGTNLILVV